MTITEVADGEHPLNIGIEMKQYEAPKLDEVGSIADVTRGEGLKGSDDTLWFFIKYGTDPSS